MSLAARLSPRLLEAFCLVSLMWSGCTQPVEAIVDHLSQDRALPRSRRQCFLRVAHVSIVHGVRRQPRRWMLRNITARRVSDAGRGSSAAYRA